MQCAYTRSRVATDPEENSILYYKLSLVFYFASNKQYI
jgi:hypothetical protein